MYSFLDLLIRRFETRFGHVQASVYAKHASESIIKIAQEVKPAIVISLIKIWCNALCTTKRFQQDCAVCPLCQTENGDCLSHVCCCPWLCDAAHQAFKCPVIPTRIEFLMLHANGRRLKAKGRALAAVHAHILISAYYAARSGIVMNTGFYKAKAIQICNTCPRTRQLILANLTSNT